MKIKKVFASGIVLCLCVQLLCCCRVPQTSSADKVYVGVTYYDQSDTFLGELLDCFKGRS